jgi:hypothetical protein
LPASASKQNAASDAQRSNYIRAMSACLQGRGYNVS